MARYMFLGRYNSRGVKGLLKEGGSKRREAVESAIRTLGGRLEAFYFAFGEYDVYGIMELPNNVTAASATLAVNATGAVSSRTVVLLTPSEMDEACRKSGRFRAPGE